MSVVIEGALEAGGHVVGTAGVQCGGGSRGPVVGGSELSAKLVGIEAGVSEDAVQRSSLELLVERGRRGRSGGRDGAAGRGCLVGGQSASRLVQVRG